MDAFIHWLLFLLNMEHMDSEDVNVSRLSEGIKADYVAKGNYFGYAEGIDGNVVYLQIGDEPYRWSKNPI